MKKFVKSLTLCFSVLTLTVFVLAFSYINHSPTSADSASSGKKNISTTLSNDNSYKLKAFINPETGEFFAPQIQESEQIPQSNLKTKVQEELVEEDAPGGGKMVVLPNRFLNFVSVQIDDDGKLNAECNRNND